MVKGEVAGATGGAPTIEPGTKILSLKEGGMLPKHRAICFQSTSECDKGGIGAHRLTLRAIVAGQSKAQMCGMRIL